MEERRSDIEQWLQQAANRQADAHTPDAVKQLAWQQLHSMLDAEGPLPGRRGWAWLMEWLLLGLLAVLLALPGSYEGGEDKVIGDNGKNVKIGAIKNTDSRLLLEKTGNNAAQKDEGNDNTRNWLLLEKAGNQNNTEKKTERKDNTRNWLLLEKADNQHNAEKKTEPKDNTNSWLLLGKAGNEDLNDTAKKTERDDNAGDRQLLEKTGNENQNNTRKNNERNDNAGDRLLLEKTGNELQNNAADIPGNDRKKNGATQKETYGTNTSRTPFSISALPVKRLSPGSAGTSLSAVQQHTHAYRAIRPENKALPSRGFSLKAGIIPPLNGQYGVNMALEYRYNIRPSLFIRPWAGVAYLNTGSRAYTHATYMPRADTIPNPIDPYWVDSVVTNYSLKNILYASASIQAAYRYRKLELYAGIAYHHQLMLTGKDSTYTLSRQITGTPPVYQRENFDKKRLPGRTNLQLQTGLSYRLSPRLQAGAQYNFLIQKSGKQAGLNGNAPAIPGSSSLELHIQWFFRKK
ncbi:autotransporter outer membrane beta-barrel domain-containing protein [Chitinophaga sp. XS-30]|uniref:autotransporter outer membrane beta-barrel domain-containing protein n=1 Tax=Chitinophaga sp. XS-30 TaxID=2604421 RepID=UPI0011DC8C9B|nr:autotransporter outer membrane beta-barrel domain-containing protein [Chitinophaga sp. XS-30]QEH39926.1 autotransporter outer membrane beta-barrel domain-containing protein [Chitinophaga sp. XS-30]